VVFALNLVYKQIYLNTFFDWIITPSQSAETFETLPAVLDICLRIFIYRPATGGDKQRIALQKISAGCDPGYMWAHMKKIFFVLRFAKCYVLMEGVTKSVWTFQQKGICSGSTMLHSEEKFVSTKMIFVEICCLKTAVNLSTTS